jgi:hypothetical protein
MFVVIMEEARRNPLIQRMMDDEVGGFSEYVCPHLEPTTAQKVGDAMARLSDAIKSTRSSTTSLFAGLSHVLHLTEMMTFI